MLTVFALTSGVLTGLLATVGVPAKFSCTEAACFLFSRSTHNITSMNLPTLKSLTSSMAGRFGVCAVALVASAAQMSDANAVVVTTFADTSVPIPANVDGLYLNFLNGASGSSSAAAAGWDINAYLTAGVFTLFWPGTPAASSGGVASAVSGGTYTDLPVGSVISSSSIFSASSGGGGPGATINFQTAGTHILGFRFFNEGTSAVNYGYMTIENGPSAGFPATVTGWVYENSGAAISVVPEPSSFALLSLGALFIGAASLRRTRRQAGHTAS